MRFYTNRSNLINYQSTYYFWESKYVEGQNKITAFEDEIKDANTLIDSLEQILKKWKENLKLNINSAQIINCGTVADSLQWRI